MPDAAFAIRTPLGFTVRCSGAYWTFIVTEKHPVLAGQQPVVEQVLRSIAACEQPARTNHVANSPRAGVLVPKVRTALTRYPSAPGLRRHATTVSLWTARPQHTR